MQLPVVTGAIDLLPRGIHKGWGLRSLMERWKIDADQIMAFGDSENDLEMLELAGYSFAMENGGRKKSKEWPNILHQVMMRQVFFKF